MPETQKPQHMHSHCPSLLATSKVCAMQALLLAQLGWLVNVYDARQRCGDAWDAHSAAHAQNVVLGRRAHLALQRAGALEQARCAVCCLMK